MTYEQLLDYPRTTPVSCQDGRTGWLVYLSRIFQEAAIDMPGEADLRWLPVSSLAPRLHGRALQEQEGV